MNTDKISGEYPSKEKEHNEEILTLTMVMLSSEPSICCCAGRLFSSRYEMVLLENLVLRRLTSFR